MSASMEWLNDSDQAMLRNIGIYGDKAKAAVLAVARYWQAVFESYAKTNRVWTDRTANARVMLHAFVEEVGDDVVEVYLSHGVNYGIHLELRYAGRYAIIWTTIEVHLVEIQKMLDGIFR
jgi:hypothetical protein